MSEATPSWIRIWARFSAPAALITAAAVVFSATVASTDAALTVATQNAGNRFRLGTVTLTDDDSEERLFTVSGLYPGRSGSNCLQVVYTGTLAARIRLFVRPGDLISTGLAEHLRFTVTEGSGGGFGDCSGFVAEDAGPLIDDVPLSIVASRDTAAAGYGNWEPVAGSAIRRRTYRFDYRVGDGANQGTSAAVSFTFQADSRVPDGTEGQP